MIESFVKEFYEAVFKPVFMNAYPEYVVSDDEIKEFSYLIQQ